MNDDFYVGYVPRAPAVLGKRIKWIAIGLVIAGVAVGAALIIDQAPFADSKFEYGIYHDYTGVIEEWPYPILRTDNTGFLLVGTGKHGVSEAVRALQGKRVRLKASLIERRRSLRRDIRALVFHRSEDDAYSGVKRHLPSRRLQGVRECEAGATAPPHAQSWGGALLWSRKNRSSLPSPSFRRGSRADGQAAVLVNCLPVRVRIAKR